MNTRPATDPLLQVVADALARNAVILAPSERSARDLRGRFDAAQSAAGHANWKPDRILTWSTWTSSLWSALVTNGHESRLLLNSTQEHALWLEVIQSGPALESLGSVHSLGDLAATAYNLAADYEVLELLSSTAATHDARTFAAWAGVFRTHCETRGYFAGAELDAALRDYVERGNLDAPPDLLLIGVDKDLTPAREHLLAALAEAGCHIERHTPNAPASLHSIVRCDNPQHEVLTAAHWIRHFIEARGATGNSSHVALIVPQLDEERPTLEASLREVLAPELQHIDADLSAGPIAFSSGPPLADCALIAAALDLVRWLAEPLDQQRVTGLLLSPYIGHTGDLTARAEFDAFHLRQTLRLRPELTLAQVVRLCEQKQGASKAWGAFLQALAQTSAQLSATMLRTYADWMEFVRAALRSANWPGERALTALEFNAARAWEHVLDSVATLDFSGKRVLFTAALEALTRQAREATSNATQTGAAVQVMRPAEAAGTTFDAIVFLHTTDALWPAPRRANPLLSWPLQRERNMPGADPALTTAQAVEATANLIASATNTLFLYPAEDATGHQRLSPLVAALGWREVPAAELIATPPPAAAVRTEAFTDAASLPALPSAEVSGGARVLKLQAACGFLAFSELRLGSAPIDSSSPGFDALETGNFLHRTMQAVWDEMKTQQALRALSSHQRDDLLNRAIDASVTRHLQLETSWDRAYLKLQKDRLLTVLRYWLEAELQRGPFSVLSLEQKAEVSVGPLTLSVRVDRIDRIDRGFVVVDYKTGASTNTRHWDGERPEDPQLPLYALLSQPGELKGVAFAKVRAGKSMSWLGYQAETGILPMKRPQLTDIDEAIQQWRQDLTFLAEDFANGRAFVNPRDFAIDCARCAQRLLCRVNPELLLAAVADEDQEGDGE